MASQLSIRQWLESTKSSGMALGLGNTRAILSSLDIKLDDTRVIHVAGSNGKGTLCSLLAASITLNGDSNIFFSSPHLCRIEERVRVNGVPVSPNQFDGALNTVRDTATQLSINPTFFETTFLTAMVIAAELQPRYLILETGLGGRLDATRCAPADLAVLTAIAEEHTDILGEDIYQIIREKAAIARPGKPLIARKMPIKNYENTVIKYTQKCANTKLGERQQDVPCTFVEIDSNTDVVSEAAEIVKEIFATLDIDQSMIEPAKIGMNWPARLQEIKLDSGHRLILDAAHNPSGIRRVKEQLVKLAKRGDNQGKITVIFGTSPQQELEVMLDLVNDILSNFDRVELYLTKPQGGRYPGIEPKDLNGYNWENCNVHLSERVDTALDIILDVDAQNVGTILSIGSLYLQGNILNYLGKNSDNDLSLLPKQ